jgi:deazaflavin-dependent oxidoreductase (nitroreductase family)
MTTPGQKVRTVPRFVLRTLWMGHRALYRFSGNRFGLSRPEAGERFGTMRLKTLGRRSGETREAIIGYYEDGPNLVTLAMNGWGQAEPAWWLNLQANPDATVDLAGGTRAVRARAATGDEGLRLWATVRDYPGWGADIDAAAALRPTPTAVVVFEPRGAGSGAAVKAEAVAAVTVAQAPSIDADRPRRLALRHLWIVPGLGIALFANAQANALQVGLVPLLVFGIVPHLTVALGIGQPHARGQLAPRAVPLFNTMHQPLVPLAVLGLAAAGVLPPFWLVGALAWLSHIVVDWGFANGLRTADGYLRASSVPTHGRFRGVSAPRVRLDGSHLPADGLLDRGALGDPL